MSLILTAVQLHFIIFFLAMNLNRETTVMVMSLRLSLYHAVTVLILNLGTVGAEVLTSRPGCFTPGKNPDSYWV